MKSLFSLILLLSFQVHATDLSQKALRITSPNDTSFSRCVAKAAVAQVVSHTDGYGDYMFHDFIGTGVDGDRGPFRTATLDFDAADAFSSYMFTVRLTSTDTTGWELLKATNNEIYPFSSSVSPHAELFDFDQAIGSVDISGCR